MLVPVLPEPPAESSLGPVDVVSAPVELPLDDADTLVIAGPLENPGGVASADSGEDQGSENSDAHRPARLDRVPPAVSSDLHRLAGRQACQFGAAG